MLQFTAGSSMALQAAVTVWADTDVEDALLSNVWIWPDSARRDEP